MLGLVAPGGRVDARVGVLHPQVVLLRPSVIVDLEERKEQNKGNVSANKVAGVKSDWSKNQNNLIVMQTSQAFELIKFS